ncbi:MAG: hypothetical protein WC955_11025, partial [Elusimicrobiota bacterium]
TFSAEHVVFNQQAGFYKDGNRFGYIKVKIIDSTTVIAGEEVYACTLKAYSNIPIPFFGKETTTDEYNTIDHKLYVRTIKTVIKTPEEIRNIEGTSVKDKLCLTLESSKGKKKSKDLPLKLGDYTAMGIALFLINNEYKKPNGVYNMSYLNENKIEWCDTKVETLGKTATIMYKGQQVPAYKIKVSIPWLLFYLTLYVDDNQTVLRGNLDVFGIDIIPEKVYSTSNYQ